MKWTPARLTSASFLTLIILGCVLLCLPVATTGISVPSLIDALFTAASAVCVTGLIVQDTPTYFSTFGQSVILALIQLGGLGIMTLSASLPVLFGSQVKLSRRDLFMGLLDQKDYEDLRNILKRIITYTFTIEFIGTAILAARFYFLWGDFRKAIFHGLFHSISAFCNAGFALFSNSITPFRDDFVIMTTLMVLITCGSIGFVVLAQLHTRRRFKNLNFHARFVVIATLILWIIPTLFIFFHEFSGALLPFSTGQKFMNALFHVISSRTAGFNTLDLNAFGNSTLFLLCIMMFIGGSPGGTAGGVKVTTIGILFLAVKSLLTGRDEIEVLGRRITRNQVTTAIGILAVSFSIVTVFMILLMMTETMDFRALFFEILSAFGTVGLSLGVTPELSTVGKLLISLLMFLGRIGPLTLVFLIGTQKQKLYYQYPEGKILLG